MLLPEFLPDTIHDGRENLGARTTGAELEFADLSRFVQQRLQAGSTSVHAEFQAITEKLLFLQVLKHTGNNLSQAAHILGISRATLRSKLAALGISIDRSISVDEES